jgi:hypothetical protein
MNAFHRVAVRADGASWRGALSEVDEGRGQCAPVTASGGFVVGQHLDEHAELPTRAAEKRDQGNAAAATALVASPGVPLRERLQQLLGLARTHAVREVDEGGELVGRAGEGVGHDPGGVVGPALRR